MCDSNQLSSYFKNFSKLLICKCICVDDITLEKHYSQTEGCTEGKEDSGWFQPV